MDVGNCRSGAENANKGHYADEQNIFFACHMRRIALLHEFRRSRRGRLRSRDASRPVRHMPTQPSGSRAGSRGGWATGGLRARTSLAPRPAPLLGILVVALSALGVRPSRVRGWARRAPASFCRCLCKAAGWRRGYLPYAQPVGMHPETATSRGASVETPIAVI